MGRTPSELWTNPGSGYQGYDLYPGTEALVGFEGPVATIRFKQLREGAEDFEYMQILSDKGEGKFLRTQVDSVATGYSWQRGEWSNDPDDLYDAREAMGNKIEKLLKL